MQEEQKTNVKQQLDTIVNNQEEITGPIQVDVMQQMYGNLIDQIRNFGEIQQAVGKTKAKVLFNKVKASLNVDVGRSRQEDTIMAETFNTLKNLMNVPQGVNLLDEITALHESGAIDASELQKNDSLFNRGLSRITAARDISTGVMLQVQEY